MPVDLIAYSNNILGLDRSKSTVDSIKEYRDTNGGYFASEVNSFYLSLDEDTDTSPVFPLSLIEEAANYSLTRNYGRDPQLNAGGGIIDQQNLLIHADPITINWPVMEFEYLGSELISLAYSLINNPKPIVLVLPRGPQDTPYANSAAHGEYQTIFAFDNADTEDERAGLNVTGVALEKVLTLGSFGGTIHVSTTQVDVADPSSLTAGDFNSSHLLVAKGSPFNVNEFIYPNTLAEDVYVFEDTLGNTRMWTASAGLDTSFTVTEQLIRAVDSKMNYHNFNYVFRLMKLYLSQAKISSKYDINVNGFQLSFKETT